jgi:hypothetical protein
MKMIFKQHMVNALLVTTLEDRQYGTDLQAVEFKCMKSAVAGTVLLVTCVTFVLNALTS